MLFCVRSTGLLESGMFVNIHQSAIKSEPAVLMTPDKVYGDMTGILSVVDCCNCGCREGTMFCFVKLIFRTRLYKH